MEKVKPSNKQLYAQVSTPKVNNILNIKEHYLNLPAKKIKNIYRIINNLGKLKSKINMTTKSPLRKQIIIFMGSDNRSRFMALSSNHITNINKALTNIKLDVRADYVHLDQNGIVIITNKITFVLDLQIVENFVKNIEHIDLDDIETSYLPQLKFYLKIIGIPYLLENTNMLINSGCVKSILKANYIFNNVMQASKPCVIRTLPKSDMTIVWLNIWNAQSGNRAKNLINRCFNIGNYIVTIHSMNMNFGISQYKNCWKWEYTTFVC